MMNPKYFTRVSDSHKFLRRCMTPGEWVHSFGLCCQPRPTSTPMRRLTISIDDELADTFDQFMQQKGYQNRSEAFRDLLRGELGRDSVDHGGAHHCVAALSYVY